MDYTLPRAVDIGGKLLPIRYDFRCILDICAALEDPDLEAQDKASVALQIFYPDAERIPYASLREAVEKCYWFINGGEELQGKKGPRLVSWEKDAKHIISPINRVIGAEIRDIPYDFENNKGGLHWWTFLSAYMEIGDCVFAQIVRIRSLLAKGKRLDKQDQEWYRSNAHLVNIPQKLSQSEMRDLALWSGQKGGE